MVNDERKEVFVWEKKYRTRKQLTTYIQLAMILPSGYKSTFLSVYLFATVEIKHFHAIKI